MLACTLVSVAMGLPNGLVPLIRIPECFVLSAASQVADEALARSHEGW